LTDRALCPNSPSLQQGEAIDVKATITKSPLKSRGKATTIDLREVSSYVDDDGSFVVIGFDADDGDRRYSMRFDVAVFRKLGGAT
jgi:hypothetical protein